MHDAQGGGGAPSDLRMDESISSLISELEDVERLVRSVQTKMQSTADKTGSGWGGGAAMAAVGLQQASGDELKKLADALGGMADLVRQNSSAVEEVDQTSRSEAQNLQSRIEGIVGPR